AGLHGRKQRRARGAPPPPARLPRGADRDSRGRSRVRREVLDRAARPPRDPVELRPGLRARGDPGADRQRRGKGTACGGVCSRGPAAGVPETRFGSEWSWSVSAVELDGLEEILDVAVSGGLLGTLSPSELAGAIAELELDEADLAQIRSILQAA